jgi:hypothetical protein
MITQPATEGQTQPAQGQPQAEPQKKIEVPAVDETQAKIDAAIKVAQETWKKEIAGLNRRNTELENEKQQLELTKLTEQERAKKELEIAQTEKDKIIAETIELKKQTAVVSKGLDPDFAKLINGKTDEEIKISLETVMSHIDKEVNKRTEKAINDRFGGAAPQGGNPPKNATLQSAYDEAKKKNAMASMTAIKRQASSEGIIITD